MGALVGGILAVFLLSMFLESMIFERALDSPRKGIPASIATAVLLAIVLYGFGNANGEGWNPFPGAISYVIAGGILYVIEMYRLRKREEAAASEPAEVFD